MAKLTKERLQKAILWAEISREDLKASKLLYENGYYNYSIYFFQQAIEKCIKSMLIFNNIDGVKTDEKLVMDVSHKTYKHLIDFVFITKDMPKQISEFLLKLEVISKKQYKKITDEDYELILHQIEVRDQNPNNRSFEIDKEYPQKLVELWLKASKIMYADKPEIFEKAKKDSTVKKEYVNTFAEAMNQQARILYLSAIVQPHMSSTRYPDDKISPLLFYNENYTMVKNYWILYNAAYGAISPLLKHYEADYRLVQLLNPEGREPIDFADIN